MAEKNGNGQQGMDLIVMLHSEVRGILEALDRQEQRSDRFEAQLGHFGEVLNQHEEVMRRFEEALRRFGESLKRFWEETRSHFANQKQLYGEMKTHVHRMAELILAIGDRLNDHDRRLAALEAKVR